MNIHTLHVLPFVLVSTLVASCFPGNGHKGFETADFSGWMAELAEPYSGQIVTSPVRCGHYAARFEIREGDEGGPFDGYRAELHELLHYIAPVGSEQWYGSSTFIPEDWPDLDNRTVITQWHATPDAGEVWRSPPLAIRYSGGRITVDCRYSAEPIQTENDGTIVILYEETEPLEKGIWHDWIFHVRWSYAGDGLVEAWLGGVQVIDYDGPVGYNDNIGVWFKWGIYRDDHTLTQVLYHDEYRRGTSYEEVDPSNCDAP